MPANKKVKAVLDSLLNKVNKVAARHRHGGVPSKRDLGALSNAQLDVEDALRENPPCHHVFYALPTTVECTLCGCSFDLVTQPRVLKWN